MRRGAALLVVALAALPACGTLRGGGSGEFLDDLSEFLGRSNPGRHVRRLVALHDTATFQHEPDLPPAYDACVEEVRILGSSGYETWRDVGIAAFYLTRVAVDDPSALSRGEAVLALRRLGKMVFEAEDPPAGSGLAEKEVTAALVRLRDIHGPGAGHRPPGPETAAECARLVRSLGDFRYDDPVEGTAGLRYRLKNLRDMIQVLVATGLADEDRTPEARGVADRTVVNIAAQAVRLSLVVALQSDARPDVRASAADALGATGAVRMLPALVAACPVEADATARREIVQSLDELLPGPAAPGAAEAVPVLLVALEDEDTSVRYNARAALKRLAGSDLGAERAPWVKWWAQAAPLR